MPKNKKIILIFFILFIFLLFIFSIIFALININNTNIINGISIGGIDVSGMSKDDAISIISEKINNKENENIKILIPENNEKNINFNDLNISYDINSSINEAYNIGRSENIFKNNFDIFKLKLNKKNINLNLTIDEERLNQLISDLSSNIQNAAIRK